MGTKSFQQYLPSPQFKRKVLLIFVLVCIVIIITKVIPSFHQKLAQNKLERSLLVKDLVIQDQNANGIQDWEEALWGLDPSKDGESNREYILNKKKLLNKDNIPESELTEDDKMSRELFALVVSLQQSGNLNQESMQALAGVVGDKVSTPEIPDIYIDTMLKIENTTATTNRNYYTALQKLNKKYENSGIGDELALIGMAMANNDSQALMIAVSTADSYRSFGKDLVSIPVPTSLVTRHLALANSYEKTAQSLESMTTMLENPIKGMSAFVDYKKYNDAVVQNIESLTAFFRRNGIIK